MKLFWNQFLNTKNENEKTKNDEMKNENCFWID